jgi:replicative DNA helicase
MNEPVKPRPADKGAAADLAQAAPSPTPVSESGGPRAEQAAVTAGDFLPILHAKYGSKAMDHDIVPSVFEFFNHSLGGWRAGLHLLAGEPGSGKTAFALHNAARAAQADYPVLYLSFDMPTEFLVTRLLCKQAELNCREVMDGAVDQEVLQAAMAAQAEVFARITVIEADPELACEEAEETARRLIADSGRNRILVIVDYLQIWAAGSRRFTEFRHEIAKLMAGMRRLALSLDSPVLAISSQNRRHQGEAILQSLEGTSDLEYSADSISFLINVERPVNQGGYTDPDDLVSKSRSVSINLRKNRFGETGSRMVKFLPATGAFDEETGRRPYPNPR